MDTLLFTNPEEERPNLRSAETNDLTVKIKQLILRYRKLQLLILFCFSLRVKTLLIY